MTCAETVGLGIELFAAFVQIGCTIYLGWLAIHQGEIISERYPVTVTTEVVNPAGQSECAGEKLVYHLKVTNLARGKAVQNCLVQLIGLARAHADTGEFINIPFPVPRQIEWAPRERTKEAHTFSHWWSVELGELNRARFKPSFYEQGGAFDAGLHGAGKVRWTILVTGDNMRDPYVTTYEFAWDGRYPMIPAERAKSFVIRRVS